MMEKYCSESTCRHIGSGIVVFLREFYSILRAAGDSGGDRRYVEDPEVNTADIRASSVFMEEHLGFVTENFYEI